MIKMIELRKSLSSFLKGKHPRVYYEEAPENAVYPYVVYSLSNSINTTTSYEQFVLDVDGWDTPVKGDTTVIETLMDSVDTGINEKTFIINDVYAVTIYRENRLVVRDEDKLIKRRKYVYQVRMHGK